MHYQFIRLEGGKTIRCPQCGFVRNGPLICRPEFSLMESLQNDVLSFCKKSCYDKYYALHPIVISEKDLREK